VLEADYKPDRNADPDDEEYGVNAIKSWRDKRASHFDAHAGGGTFQDIQNYAQLILEYLNQSQVGMCICRTAGIRLGFRQECFRS